MEPPPPSTRGSRSPSILLGLCSAWTGALAWHLWPVTWPGLGRWLLIGGLGVLAGWVWSRRPRQASDADGGSGPPSLAPANAPPPSQTTAPLQELALDRLHQMLPVPILLHRGSFILDANAAAAAVLGYPSPNALRATELDTLLASTASRQAAFAQIRGVLIQPITPGMSPAYCDCLVLTGEGLPRSMRLGSMLLPALGPDVVLSWLFDATPQNPPAQAPAPATSSQTLLSHFVSTSPDAITLSDLRTGRYSLVNPTFEKLTGYQAEDVIGRTAQELGIWARPAERAQLVESLRQHHTVRNIEATIRARDGQELRVQLSASRFTLDGREYLFTSARDITQSEQIRQEYQLILEQAMIGIAMTRDSHFLMVNPRLEQMLGWPPGTLVGQHANVVWSSIDAFERASADVLPRLLAGEQIELEVPLVRRDGTSFLCRLLGKAIGHALPRRSGIIWLAEDVTERSQMDQALAKARDDAETASHAKSAFLANTSHELRTPLNALLGLARLARQPEVDELRRREYIEQISDSAETLSAIISDILDLSKIEAGKMHLDQLPFRLDGLLRSLYEAYGALADTKGLGMRLQVDRNIPDVVVGDPVRLRQILSNYLTNALKFTGKGSVTLAVHSVHGPVLRFEVTDTGPGISQEDQQRLFTPFTQVENPTGKRTGGTGLGLSISRELARLMGGEVGVESAPGRGSCFWAELPLPESSHTELDSSTGSDGMDPVMGARVLMVEDNPVNMMISVALLEQWGANVVQAHDGREALAAVERARTDGHPFDVVLMDVQMPGMNGHEATRALRQTYSADELPIVALTAAALVSEREEALAGGMNDFLTKPIDPHRLRSALVRILRRQISTH
jgi:PAS domain S-box-containing protein